METKSLKRKITVLIVLAVIFLSVSVLACASYALANSNSDEGYIVYIGNDKVVLAYYHAPDGHRYCLNWSTAIPTDAFTNSYGTPK